MQQGVCSHKAHVLDYTAPVKRDLFYYLAGGICWLSGSSVTEELCFSLWLLLSTVGARLPAASRESFWGLYATGYTTKARHSTPERGERVAQAGRNN